MFSPCGFLGAGRAVAREYLDGGVSGWWALRLRRVGHHLVGRCGGVGGGRRGGERGALYDPINIIVTIVCGPGREQARGVLVREGLGQQCSLALHTKCGMAGGWLVPPPPCSEGVEREGARAPPWAN